AARPCSVSPLQRSVQRPALLETGSALHTCRPCRSKTSKRTEASRGISSARLTAPNAGFGYASDNERVEGGGRAGNCDGAASAARAIAACGTAPGTLPPPKSSSSDDVVRVSARPSRPPLPLKAQPAADTVVTTVPLR